MARVLVVAVAIAMQACLLHADWSSDRLRDDPFRRVIAPQVRRVYLGKQRTNQCLRGRREGCIQALGEPTERREPFPGEEHLIFRGKAILAELGGRVAERFL